MAIVVQPGSDPKGEPEVEITGRLAALIGGDVFPQADVPRMMVAGARFVHSRHPDEGGDQPLGFLFILPRVKAR